MMKEWLVRAQSPLRSVTVIIIFHSMDISPTISLVNSIPLQSDFSICHLLRPQSVRSSHHLWSLFGATMTRGSSAGMKNPPTPPARNIWSIQKQ